MLLTRAVLLGLLGSLVWAQPIAGNGSDSLAYIFRQDNLSTNNDLQFHYQFALGHSDLLLNDGLRYKVYAYQNELSPAQQYSIEHRFRSDWMWGASRSRSLRIESNQYQDHRTGLASSISNLALLAGMKKGSGLSAFIGRRSVERYGLVEDGWTAEFEAQGRHETQQQLSDYQISGERDQLNAHLNYNLDLRANYQLRFGSAAYFQSSLVRGSRLQNFFTDSLGSSQTRKQTELNWHNQFNYQLWPGARFYYQLVWQDQLTRIDQEKISLSDSIKLPGEDRKHFSLDNEAGVAIDQSGFTLVTAFRIKNAQNRYYIDYTQAFYQLRQRMTWQIPDSQDSLVWSSQLSRLEYDTPDSTNDDDRDEWRLHTELYLIWQPSPFYQLELGTKLSLFHLIYLFNTRSGENHWNRNLVLWSGFDWRHQHWTGSGQTRIRSNYFDYDYDELFIEQEQPTRSFVHRSLDLRHELNYRFDRRWAVSTKISARWEDEGQLDWDAFVQQLSRERQQVEVILKLFYDYRSWRGWLGVLGHQRLTSYTAPGRATERWAGSGPVFGVRHRLSGRLYLDADARVISVRDQGREYVLPKIFFTLVYR